MSTVMKKTLPGLPDVTRNEAIELVRSELLKQVDDETCICKAAAEQKIFCRGFARYGDREFRARYSWLVTKRPDATRPELEELANEWQLARQDVRQTRLACDVQQAEHDSCRGWDDFSNEDLSRFVSELMGKSLVVA
jgi:hypothetical protein